MWTFDPRKIAHYEKENYVAYYGVVNQHVQHKESLAAVQARQ